jgi:hypothetical protein
MLRELTKAVVCFMTTQKVHVNTERKLSLSVSDHDALQYT